MNTSTSGSSLLIAPPTSTTHATHVHDPGVVMIRKRVVRALAIAAATAGVTALGVTAAPVAGAEERIPLPNGLTVILQDAGRDGTRVVRTQGAPRVGDYVTQKINWRFPNGNQFERDIDAATQLSGGFQLGRNEVDVSVQACRPFTLAPSQCTAWSSFKNIPKTIYVPPQGPEPPKPEPPKPPPLPQMTKCPAGGLKPEVPAGEKCPAPTNAVRVTFTRGAFQWTVNVKNDAGIGGSCSYKAIASNGSPGTSRNFDIGPNGTETFQVPAPLPFTTYHVVTKCTGTYDGQQVEFGHDEQDVSL